jgi:hypothetical protein
MKWVNLVRVRGIPIARSPRNPFVQLISASRGWKSSFYPTHTNSHIYGLQAAIDWTQRGDCVEYSVLLLTRLPRLSCCFESLTTPRAQVGPGLSRAGITRVHHHAQQLLSLLCHFQPSRTSLFDQGWALASSGNRVTSVSHILFVSKLAASVYSKSHWLPIHAGIHNVFQNKLYEF